MTESTEVEEGHDGIKEYAVNSTCENNDDSKNPSDGENTAENSNEESQSVHDYEGPLASNEFSLNQFYQDFEEDSDTYYDVADSAQEVECEQCFPISSLLSVCCSSRRSSRPDHDERSNGFRNRHGEEVRHGAFREELRVSSPESTDIRRSTEASTGEEGPHRFALVLPGPRR